MSTDPQLIDILVKACSERPKPEGFSPSYGTAGFRADASLLSSTTFRCGIVIACRALTVQSSCGIMITASHNTHTDNGVKLVDPNGDMLPQDWEPLTTKLAQATNPEELATALLPLIPKTLKGPADLAVLIGHDTRSSSPELAAAAAAGIALLGLAVQNVGCVTTPQLHFAVVDFNAKGKLDGEAYFETLLSGFEELWEVEGTGDNAQQSIVVDCANGVGAEQLRSLLERMERMPGGRLQLQLRNTGEGLLNENVGADFVQKQKKAPLGFGDVPPGTRCCCMDGDADRLVYFTTEADGSFHLVDGDRIAALAATFVQSLVSELPQELADNIKIGVVQTAYANGASTRYIQQVLKLPVVMTKTGVKHLHAAAHNFDVGIYFESNGHGTVLLASSLADRLVQVQRQYPAASKLLALRRMVNQTVGDALSLILMSEVLLRYLSWTLHSWLSVYTDVPSCQSKLKVVDRTVITTSEDDTRCLTPAGLQSAIDEAVLRYRIARAFVRPSGTEDIVRIYAEADSQEAAEKLAVDVMRGVYDMAGGTGDRP